MMQASGEILDGLHLLALAAYFGAQFALMYMLLPAADAVGIEDLRRAVLVRGFSFYNPFSIATLGAGVISGAIRITDLKAAMKFEYFTQLGGPLSLKLLLAFVLILIQTYLTFGLTFRICRQEEVAAHGDGPPLTAGQLNSMLGRIRLMSWSTIILSAAIVYVSLVMAPMVRAAVR